MSVADIDDQTLDQMLISVIICTHNPRAEYLRRTLKAIEEQSLAGNCWELLLIDNASEQALADRFDLSWHPNSRHIREESIGLTPARLRGIREAESDLLVFVDDDNLLASDYLEKVLQIHGEYPHLAALGGSITPEYELEPPIWFHKYRQMIAIREVTEDRWSNNPEDFSSTPIGAGMVITRKLGLRFLEDVSRNEFKKILGRRGNQLTGGEDVDIALTACDFGMGKGVFACLKVIHIIPSSRTELSYLLRLQEGTAQSITIRQFFRGQDQSGASPSKSPLFKLAKIIKSRIKMAFMPPRERAFIKAWIRGTASANETIRGFHRAEGDEMKGGDAASGGMLSP